MKIENKIYLKRLIIFSIAIGLCLTTIQIGAVSTTKSDNFVRLVNRHDTPIPEKITKSEISIPLTANNIKTLSNIPVVSTEDDEIHPAITKYGNNLLFGGYTRQLAKCHLVNSSRYRSSTRAMSLQSGQTRRTSSSCAKL